ncbi:MAG: putative DNA binding domain-containing protein [Methylobacter sp.]|uniref:RNA-binding domain-containing protein n=1 Tax=Methylobacter sp. TaxID=2051955 RepID=UPI00258BDCE1|nr:RNA-binding domain-containing protein [Methylobacter sp.]MCL7421756.1 putative DNA binding domain-containing protein [Methylobacter sp.]
MTDYQLIIEELAESSELECKLAGGRDGKGKLPDDFWSTYSAFANTQGGTVLLGVKEKPRGKFQVEGITDPQKIITDLFNNLNNPQKVSCNLIADQDIEILQLNGKNVIQISVRRASRHEKPVHLGSTPFGGNSYRRLHEGDRKLDDESVRRLLAERIEDERDSRILPGFGMEDIDLRSLGIYRQMLRDAKGATHPFLTEDDKGLLTKLRGWRKDRQTGNEGLTLAGVLMFGTWDAIQEAAPHYFVDYQERPEAKTERRWVDRVYPDGTWSGNLFDFYRIVYRKLTDPETLKIPFRLKEGQRQDDTPVHEAIREALVNSIVHADYSGRVSVLVVKRPDMIGFRNPGDMRIPFDRAIKGGDSDCRNRIMHQMFLMIGLGERAGSGIPKIYSGWNWRHWRAPALYEIDEPPQTLLELRMLELMPAGVLDQLQEQLGDDFNALPQLERLILATAVTEQVVSHKRLTEICADHSHDITLALGVLVKKDLLVVNGHGRGAIYSLPGQNLPTPEQVFGESVLFDLPGKSSSEDLPPSSEDLPPSSEDLPSSSEDLSLISEDMDEFGRLLSRLLSAPVVHDLAKLTPEFRDQLEARAREPRTKKRLPKEVMQQVLIDLCKDQFITRQCLAQLVKRDPDSLRQQYLTELVDEQKLTLAFPQSPTDSRQAYMTNSKSLTSDA